ncbi:MAG TPA: PASTA domain-containing protein [Thermoleophilaceae bacterium]
MTKKQAKPAARSKVLAQKPKAGTKKPAGSKVALTLGR